MSNVYLAHHGILGQKWGVRRFQNKDGTLTEAGKKRYSDYVDRETALLDRKYALKIAKSENRVRKAENAATNASFSGNSARQAKADAKLKQAKITRDYVAGMKALEHSKILAADQSFISLEQSIETKANIRSATEWIGAIGFGILGYAAASIIGNSYSTSSNPQAAKTYNRVSTKEMYDLMADVKKRYE